ncbi:MAG: lytic transglycosylase domain-containing protein [Kiritimatiellia bacterium]|jgi:hypothetical protein
MTAPRRRSRRWEPRALPSPAVALAIAAATAALCLSGCLSFDEDGNLFFDPPRFDSRESFIDDLRHRLDNHDPDAVREFFARGFEALHGDNPDDLARLQSCAAAVSERSPAFPGAKEYASWLESRMLYFEAAEEARLAEEQARRTTPREREAPYSPPPPLPQEGTPCPPKPLPWVGTPCPPKLPPLPETYKTKPKPPPPLPWEGTPRPPKPPRPQTALQTAGQDATRGRAYWSKKIARRTPPRRANELVPRLERIFEASGLPPQLVWVAEVESTLDPAARSPAGAVGLFQLMPRTAQSLGLELSPRDQRLDPEHNARAAATYLKTLHRRFGSWPLALAAYNAGEGRVAKLCRRRNTRNFDDIADALPTETQMYVPRVLETIRARTGADPDTLPPPRG